MCRFLTSIWGGLFSISLDLHSTGDSAVGFSTRQISHVEEGVVEGGEQMHHTEVVGLGGGASLRWSEVGHLLFLHFNFFLGSLQRQSAKVCLLTI